MPDPVKAKYKQYDLTTQQWIEYYFRTTADQVGEIYDSQQANNSLTFVSNRVSVRSGNTVVPFTVGWDSTSQKTVAYVTITGANLVGGAVPVPDHTLQYVSDSDNISVALGKLDAAAHAASQSVPSEYLVRASVSGNTLTIVPHSGSNISFSGETYTFAEGTTNGAFSVTPASTNVPQTVSIHGLGAAAYKGLASSISSSDTGLATAQQVYNAIDALPEPMVFKGSLGTNGTYTSLPTANAEHEGWTLKVITRTEITSGKYAEVGDTIICCNTSQLSTPFYEWVIIPSGDEPSGTVTSVNLSNYSSGTTSQGTIDISGGPITSSGAINIKLIAGYADHVNPYASNHDAGVVLAAPANAAGVPSFRRLTVADLPDLGDAYLPIDAGSDYPLTGDLYFYDANAYIEVNDDALTDKAYFAFRAQGGVYWFSNNEQNNSYFAKLDASHIEGNVTLTVPNSTGTIALQGWVNSQGFARTTVGDSAPSTPTAGDIWLDTSN